MIPARSLLLSDPAANRALALLVGMLVFLFMLCLIAAGLVFDASARVSSAANDSWVVIAPADEARNNQLLEVLEKTPGLKDIRVLENAEKNALLARWLAAPPAGSELPLVVDIVRDAAIEVDTESLKKKLLLVDAGASLDTGASFKDSIGSVLSQIEHLLGGALLLLLIVLLGLVYLVTKITLQHNLSVLELLHLMGATDRYILGRFQIIALRLVAPACAGGTILAFAVLGLIYLLMPKTGLGWLWQSPNVNEWPLLSIVPLAVLGMAVLTCRQTVLIHLRQKV